MGHSLDLFGFCLYQSSHLDPLVYGIISFKVQRIKNRVNQRANNLNQTRCIDARRTVVNNILDQINGCYSQLTRNVIEPFTKRMVTGDEKSVGFVVRLVALGRNRSLAQFGPLLRVIYQFGIFSTCY